MNKTLLDFEEKLGVCPTQAARLLGVAWSTYSQYKNLRRELPRYIVYHIDTLESLRKEHADRIIRKRVLNGS